MVRSHIDTFSLADYCFPPPHPRLPLKLTHNIFFWSVPFVVHLFTKVFFYFVSFCFICSLFPMYLGFLFNKWTLYNSAKHRYFVIIPNSSTTCSLKKWCFVFPCQLCLNLFIWSNNFKGNWNGSICFILKDIFIYLTHSIQVVWVPMSLSH